MTSKAISVDDIDESIFTASVDELDGFERDVPAFVQQAKVEGLGASTGAFMALALEAAIGIGVYFIWRLLHAAL